MIKYEGNISYTDNLRADLTAGILFGAFKFMLHYGDELEGGLYLLGFKIKTLDQIAYSGNTNDKVIGIRNDEDQTENDPTGNSQNETEEDALNDLETLKKLLKKALAKVKETRIVLMDLLQLSDAQMRHTIVEVFKNILKQILPRRIEGDFKFGTDDPYYTGKILEIFAILYAKMGDDFRIEPVWDNTCFHGELKFEGKIHVTVITWNLLKLIFNSQFREVWREHNGK